MKKAIVKLTDNFIKQALKLNVNSTTSIMAYQPKMPAEVKLLSKIK